MSDELVQWLGEQLSEDERIARAVTTPGVWRVGRSHGGSTIEGEGWSVGNADDLDAAHIAEHDPARVLRETHAKRELLNGFIAAIRLRHKAAARLQASGGDPGPSDLRLWDQARLETTVLERVIRLLALPYADRPGYREEWRP